MLFPPPACACIGRDEKGRLDIWPLYPGVELTLQAYSAKAVAFHHDVPGAAMLEINHCYAGRVGYTSGAEPALYLGEGDLSLHGLHTGVESVMQFPFDGYLGFSFRVDVARLDANLPDFMREAGVSGAQILARFCGENGFSVLSSAEQVGALLDPLYTLPERLLIPYAKLKFQELMLLLSVMDAPPVTQSAYQAEQIALIRRIHDQMMSDMSQRCTIEMLSQQYHINTSTLKSLFKTVYGQPLAAHMKEHRMEYAARLLRTTTDSLAEIAEKYWRLRRRAEYLARHSLRARIAAFLLDAAADAGGNTFSLGMRREDLAAYLGANRSALCRELSRLRAEGWIDCCRDSVRLINTAALAKSAAAENRSGEK